MKIFCELWSRKLINKNIYEVVCKSYPARKSEFAICQYVGSGRANRGIFIISILANPIDFSEWCCYRKLKKNTDRLFL